ncbi:aspartyl protease APCB1-like [Zingiber officinale]|uniref:aspartyl protease APCB1-like n=1 Tax=Zingiber officinale TaxID=94328 RepID=UPI001C4C3F9F|nr:aspartyl protease APCB1-like [Zingiber officinale]
MEGERPSPPPPPQLHGVIIISLPPPDDPSKGKTITAFTFSDDSPPPPPLPVPSVEVRHSRARHGRRYFLSRRRVAVFALGAAFLLVSLWICLFSESPLQMVNGTQEENDTEEKRSFLFQLYPKSGRRSLRELGDVKLGSFGARHFVGSWKMRSSRRTETTDSSAIFPIGGNLFPDGQYYTTIFVGSSPRPYFLDVDTGSDLTWIQCDAPCTSCAKGPHPLYKPNRGNIVLPSNSFCMEVQRNQNYHYCDSCEQCDYEIEYADHSSSMGVLARDDMHIIDANGEKAKFSFTFGCAYDQQGQLLASPAKTDGILGLSSSKVSLPSQLESQGIISNVIGHCIKREAKGGGYMFLGDDYVPQWGVTWVPRQSGLTNFYISKASKINYGGKQISGQKGNAVPVIFDTGSSYTYFPDEAYGKLTAYLQSMSNNFIQDVSDLTMPICLRADFPIRSFKDVKQFFEPLTLQFEKKWWTMSKSFTIQPEGYLVISDKGNVCLGVLNGTEVHDGSTVILGDISLRGKLVVYDNTQQKIGWVQSECAKPQKSTGFAFFV